MNSFPSSPCPDFDSVDAIAQKSIILGKYRGSTIAFQGCLSEPVKAPSSALLLRYRGTFYLKPH